MARDQWQDGHPDLRGGGAGLPSTSRLKPRAPPSMSTFTLDECVRYVQTALAAVADPAKARAMRAYMKAEMPFYGVQKPARAPIARRLVAAFPPGDRDEYEALVLALWGLPHREEKYLALHVARHFQRYVDPDSLPLYRRLIVEGAWWDLVDEVATHLVRHLVTAHPGPAWAEVDPWIEADDLWLRRSAIICQVGAKERTDRDRLFSFCAARAGEADFFIRKAIGWALRDYARTDPEAVARFVTTHRDRLSPLSYREATRHLGSLAW